MVNQKLLVVSSICSKKHLFDEMATKENDSGSSSESIDPYVETKELRELIDALAEVSLNPNCYSLPSVIREIQDELMQRAGPEKLQKLSNLLLGGSIDDPATPTRAPPQEGEDDPSISTDGPEDSDSSTDLDEILPVLRQRVAEFADTPLRRELRRRVSPRKHGSEELKSELFTPDEMEKDEATENMTNYAETLMGEEVGLPNPKDDKFRFSMTIRTIFFYPGPYFKKIDPIPSEVKYFFQLGAYINDPVSQLVPVMLFLRRYGIPSSVWRYMCYFYSDSDTFVDDLENTICAWYCFNN